MDCNPSRINRREALRIAAGRGAAAALAAVGVLPVRGGRPAAQQAGLPPLDERKLILVLFGGGTRSSESIGDPEHSLHPAAVERNGPAGNAVDQHAGRAPRGPPQLQCLDQDGPLGIRRPRLVATAAAIPRSSRSSASSATCPTRPPGRSSMPRSWPTRAAAAPRATASRFAANVVEPPTIPRAAAEEMDRLHGGRARRRIRPRRNEQAAARCAGWPGRPAASPPPGCARDRPRHGSTGSTRHGERRPARPATTSFSPIAPCACMQQFSPQVMSVDFGEIDCAHYGSWSRYVEAIRRTDELTWRLWQAAQSLPAYRGKTLMLVLPDHGRELERPGRERVPPSQRFLHGPGGRRRLPPRVDAGRRAGHQAGPTDRPPRADHCRRGHRASIPRLGGVPGRGPAGSGCLADSKREKGTSLIRREKGTSLISSFLMVRVDHNFP